MKTKLTFTLICICLAFYAEAQWQQMHPRPIGWAATSISDPGENRVYAVAASSILISKNLGATWEAVNLTDGSPYFYEISFANPLQGIACSSYGKVYVTSDGGQTWTIKQLTPSADLYTVMILPSGIGFAGGEYGKLFKTTDFGETWTSVNETFDQDDIAKIFMLDDNNVFLYDDWDAFYWSNNGGQTWSMSVLSNINKAHSMHFFDSQKGLLGDDYGKLLKTTNGGQSWQKIFDDGETAFYSMSFLNENKGIVGCYDKLMITNDGGQNWQNIEMPDHGDFHAVEWKTENIIYASCDGGVIIRSMDGGLSWEMITEGPASSGFIYAAAYFDNNTILAFTIFPTEIIKSTNRGFSWQKIPPPGEGYFRYRNACAISGEVLYVSTFEGKIFKTTNGGDSWQLVETGITEQIGSVHFLTADIGFYVANNGTINRTINGGETWSTVFSGTSNLTKISFFNDQIGLAVGAGGTILRTTDGGINWASISNDNTNIFRDVHFVNQTLVFAVGEWGRVYRSQDAGLTWSRITTNVNNDLYSVVFSSPEVGYITTSVFGTNLKTENGGATWNYSSYLASGSPRAIKTPNGSIMVYGEYGHISILPQEGTWNPPATPIANAASGINENSFLASWQPSEGASAYVLLVSEDNFQTYLPGYGPQYSEQAHYQVTGIEGNKTYYYKVLAANEAGYSDYSNTIIVETTATNVTSIIETGFKIYPNPTRDFLTLEINDFDPKGWVCHVYDFYGRLIQVNQISGSRTIIDVSNLVPAVYFLRVINGSKDAKTLRIVKN